MLRLAFDFIITWRETRTRPNAYVLWGRSQSHNKNYSLFWGSIVIRNNVTKNIFRNRQILLNKFVIVLFLKNKVDCQNVTNLNRSGL